MLLKTESVTTAAKEAQRSPGPGMRRRDAGVFVS